MEVNKLVDLNNLRTAPKLNYGQETSGTRTTKREASEASVMTRENSTLRNLITSWANQK